MSRPRLLGLCALLAAVSAVPKIARAIEANATAGLGLGRWDTWAQDVHSTTNIPDWQLSANLSGQPFRPGLLDWRAGASYMGLRDYAPDMNSNRSGWSYQLSSALLSYSNFPITLSASRATSSFATDVTSGQTGTTVTQTGTTETSQLSSTMILRAPLLPSLRLQGAWVDSTNTPIGGASTNLDTKIVNAGISQSLGNQTYAVDYSSTWNSGNYTLNNYRSDYLNAQFITTPRPDVTFRFREYYALRTPTNNADLNPRYDDNMLSAGVVYRPGQRWTSSLDYNFHHALVSAAGAPSVEQTSHGISETTNFRYRPNLQIFAGGGVGYTYEQLQDQRMRGGNQNLGGGANWQVTRGRTTLLSSGNAQLAGLETTNQAFTLGYGLGGSEGVTHTRGPLNMGLTYAIAYASNATGLGGSTLTQSLYGSTDGLVGRGLQLRSILNYSQTRRSDPLLGDFQNHTLTFIGRAALRRLRDFYSVDLTLGESDGLAESVATTVATPAPILSSTYNTRSRFATLQATQTLLRGKLAIIEVGRLMRVEMPEQPSQHEESAWLSVRYAIGQIYLTAEDRLSRGGSTGPSVVSNLFMLRLSRNFGARF